MSWFTDIISTGVDKVVDSVGNAIDKNMTTDHERMQMQNELEKIRLQAKLDAAKLEAEAESKMDEEVTKRWQADMQGDDPAAKKVRPYSLVYMLFLMTVIILGDSIQLLQFEVKDSYISLVETLLVTMVVAYFGSRGIEKVSQIKNGKK